VKIIIFVDTYFDMMKQDVVVPETSQILLHIGCSGFIQSSEPIGTFELRLGQKALQGSFDFALQHVESLSHLNHRYLIIIKDCI
jgi:hypothetical protein